MFRGPLEVALDRLVQSTGRHAIKHRQIAIKYNLNAADRADLVLYDRNLVIRHYQIVCHYQILLKI